MAPAQYKVGDRIQLHPGTDRWMRGDKFGEVVFVSRRSPFLLKVKFERSGKTLIVDPVNVLEVIQ